MPGSAENDCLALKHPEVAIPMAEQEVPALGFLEQCAGRVAAPEVLDFGVEHAAQVARISTMITHADMHRRNIEKLADRAVGNGVRDLPLLSASGTQVTDELTRSWGVDVASVIVESAREPAWPR